MSAASLPVVDPNVQRFFRQADRTNSGLLDLGAYLFLTCMCMQTSCHTPDAVHALSFIISEGVEELLRLVLGDGEGDAQQYEEQVSLLRHRTRSNSSYNLFSCPRPFSVAMWTEQAHHTFHAHTSISCMLLHACMQNVIFFSTSPAPKIARVCMLFHFVVLYVVIMAARF